MNKKINLLLAYIFLSSVFFNMYQVLFNLYLKNISISNTFISKITSLELFGSALLGMFIAILGEKIGKKKTILISSLFSGIILIIRVIFPLPSVLLFFAFFNGGFSSARIILINTFLVNITNSSNRGKAFGYNVGLSMGSGVFGNLFGGLLGDILGLKNVLVVSALLYLISTFILFYINNKKDSSDFYISEIFNFKSLNPKEKRILYGFFLSTLLIGFGAGLFIHFGNIIFKDLFNMSPTIIGVALSIAQVGTSFGAIMSPYLSKKYGPLNYTIILQFIVVPLIFSLSFVRNPYIFTIIYAMRFSFMNMTTPVLTTIVFSFLPENKITSVNSLNNLFNNLIRALATSLFGIIVGNSSNYGYSIIFIISGIFYFANWLVCLIFFYPLKNEKKILKLYAKNSK